MQIWSKKENNMSKDYLLSMYSELQYKLNCELNVRYRYIFYLFKVGSK